MKQERVRQPKATPRAPRADPPPAAPKAKATKAKAVKDDIDEVLADIDKVLAENAIEGLTAEEAMQYQQVGGE